jgi:hypothetical protein
MSEFQLDDVRVIKLTTGEVVIGFQGATTNDLDENPELDNYLIVRFPYQVDCKVLEREQNSPSFGISCYRWMPFIQDDALLIQKHNVIAIGIPDDDLLGVYTNLIEMMVFGMVSDGDEN